MMASLELLGTPKGTTAPRLGTTGQLHAICAPDRPTQIYFLETEETVRWIQVRFG